MVPKPGLDCFDWVVDVLPFSGIKIIWPHQPTSPLIDDFPITFEIWKGKGIRAFYWRNGNFVSVNTNCYGDLPDIRIVVAKKREEGSRKVFEISWPKEPQKGFRSVDASAVSESGLGMTRAGRVAVLHPLNGGGELGTGWIEEIEKVEEGEKKNQLINFASAVQISSGVNPINGASAVITPANGEQSPDRAPSEGAPSS